MNGLGIMCIKMKHTLAASFTMHILKRPQQCYYGVGLLFIQTPKHRFIFPHSIYDKIMVVSILRQWLLT